jgi:hypothetical protein
MCNYMYMHAFFFNSLGHFCLISIFYFNSNFKHFFVDRFFLFRFSFNPKCSLSGLLILKVTIL